MAATQIESFCERCGTKYTFDQRPERGRLLKGLGRTLGFLPEEGAPDDAPATSRDPFHGTFRFCLECRQYTCPTCWNETAGFCQGCAPLPQGLDMTDAEAFAAVEAASHLRHAMTEVNLLRSPEAWPDIDLSKPDQEQPVIPTLADADFAESEPFPGALRHEVDLVATGLPQSAGVVAADELYAETWDAVTPAQHEAEPESNVDWQALHHRSMAVEPLVMAGAEPETEHALDELGEGEPELVAQPEREPEDGLPLAAAEAQEPEAPAPIAQPDRIVEPEAQPQPLPLAAAAAQEPELPAQVVREVPSLMTPVTALRLSDAPAPIPDAPAPIRDAPAPSPAAATPVAPARPQVAPVASLPLPSLMRPPEAAAQPAAGQSGTTRPAPSVPPSPFAPAEPPTMTPAAVPASRLAALFGRGRKQTEPDVTPPPVPSMMPSGWRITAEDTTPQVPSAAFLPRPEVGAPHAAAQAPRASLIAAPSQAHSTPGIRPCYQCALPLSATARFCRRCGTPQQPGA